MNFSILFILLDSFLYADLAAAAAAPLLAK